MPSIIAPSVFFHRNDTFRPALAALVEVLMRRNYTSHMIGRIFDHAAVHGTLAGAPGLDPADEAAVEEAFVDNLPELPADSEAWGRNQDVLFDVEMLLEGNHPWPLVQDCDDDREFEPLWDPADLCHACRSPHIIEDRCATCSARQGREAEPLPFPCEPHPLYDFPCEDEPPMCGYE
jgi:hypothetical protein